jgi:MoaA/NifB/PqqE/SkfB family radical SAM enzyme
MNTNQIKSIIDQLSELGVLSISLTGGEPTLRKDLPEIIYHTGVINNFMNGIATNGYLLPKMLKEHKMEGLDYILLSLDYPNADLHNRVRGIKVFNRVIESIKLANKRDIKPIISTVVMKNNLGLLEDICALAENLDCSIELYPCENIIRDFPSQQYQVQNIDQLIPNIIIWANSVRHLRTKFKNILTDPISVEVIEKGGFGGYPEFHQKILRCHVAEAYLFVRHDGLLSFPCKIHPILSFNALKTPISKAYNSIEVRKIMKKHDTYQFCDRCRLGCAIVSSMPARWKTFASKFIMGFLEGNLS